MIKHIVSPGEYAAFKMQVRNEWMVDQLNPATDLLLAAWDGSPGGTGNCVKYATGKGVGINRLDPLGYLFER